MAGFITHTKQDDIKLDRELREIIAKLKELDDKVSKKNRASVSDKSGDQGVFGLKMGARAYSVAVPTQDGYVRLLPGLLVKQTVQDPPPPVAGQILIAKADGTYIPAHLSAGTNITITNGDGAITITGPSYSGPANIRAGVESVSTSGTGVSFDSALPDTSYVLLVNVWKTEGGIHYQVGYSITSRSTTGFTITPVEDCTCEYVALDYTPPPP